MKKTVLVSGASGIVGYGILRSLLKKKEEYSLIGTTIYDESIAPAFCDVFELAVPTNSENYIDWLSSVIKKHSVDILIPSIEADMYLWNDHREEIEEAGAMLLLNTRELIDLCKDKWNFYKSLVDDIPEYLIPTTDDLSTNIYGYPYIVKPKRGFGSKGVIKIKNENDYYKNKDSFSSELIMQPIIGTDDNEYTVAGFFDKSHNLIDFIGFKRKLSTDGFTHVAQVVDYEFESILIEIASVVKPIGPTNFQFRLFEGTMRLLEINPRISSSTSIRASLGYNESKMAVDYYLDGIVPEPIDKTPIINRTAVRYIDEYIF